MKKSKRLLIYTFCAFIVSLSIGGADLYGLSFRPLLPKGLVIKDEFSPGLGTPVGKVLLVQGEAVIMHEEKGFGYRMRKGLPLFKGDTIVTLPKARVRMGLNDGSVITMASKTKMVINRSVFDRVKKRFASFLRMSVGKARFWVKKTVEGRHPEYRVKTPTAVVGVRGSDFISGVTDFITTITALEDTRLDAAGTGSAGSAACFARWRAGSTGPRGCDLDRGIKVSSAISHRCGWDRLWR